jgi:hypothetical protein
LTFSFLRDEVPNAVVFCVTYDYRVAFSIASLDPGVLAFLLFGFSKLETFLAVSLFLLPRAVVLDADRSLQLTTGVVKVLGMCCQAALLLQRRHACCLCPQPLPRALRPPLLAGSPRHSSVLKIDLFVVRRVGSTTCPSSTWRMNGSVSSQNTLSLMVCHVSTCIVVILIGVCAFR